MSADRRREAARFRHRQGGRRADRNTEQGLFKGKLAYVAPERITNETLDGRVDLFSLGVVLWEMLAGRRLFRGKSELETLNNVLEMKVPPPSRPPPRCPARRWTRS